MLKSQEIWWQQARSDHSVFLLLRRQSVAPCHLLHYLQMATEKLTKAYFCRDNQPPSLRHVGLRDMLKALATGSSRERVARILEFRQGRQYVSWTRQGIALAVALENLSPSAAKDGPNAEYPWPHANPVTAPAQFQFPLWITLSNTAQGRQFLKVVDAAINRFDQFA